jgi:hypothetical protein
MNKKMLKKCDTFWKAFFSIVLREATIFNKNKTNWKSNCHFIDREMSISGGMLLAPP